MADAAVFLDRDGTLIEDADFATRPEEIRILGGVARALADLGRAGYKLIVVTNQSGLARGLLTEDDLERFHQALDDHLDVLGVQLDAYYVCPHHPDLPDSPRPDLVVECECRKPKPGLMLRAAEDFNIDLDASWLVGDTWRDIAAGQAAGVKTVKVPADAAHEGARPPDVAPPTAEAADLAAAARIILGTAEAEPVSAPPQDLPDEAIATKEPASGFEADTRRPVEQDETVGEETFPEEQTRNQAESETPRTGPATRLEAPPHPPAVPGHCARCGRDVAEADLAAGRAAERGGFLLCAECLSTQPRQTGEPLAGDETDLLRAVLVELRRLNRAQRTPGVTWLRLLAYVLEAAALFCGLALVLVGDDKALYLRIGIFLQLVVIALVLFERKP